MPNVSVIVPVYNVEKYLDKCLQSIINQTYKDIEIIIVNDGSTDSSLNICEKYAEKHDNIILINKENGGLSDARNVGMQHASGDYYMFVDSDDFVSENIVKVLYNLCVKNDATIAICDPIHIKPNDAHSFESNSYYCVYNSEDALIEMLYQKSFLVSAWAKLYKKSCFENTEFPVGMFFEDSAVMYKIFDQADKIVYTKAKLYAYVHRDGSITTNEFSKKDLDILKICDEMENYFKNSSQAIRNAVIAYRVSAAFRLYLNIPPGQYKKVKIECKKIIDDNYSNLINNKIIRKKMKYALIIYRYFHFIMKYIYRKVDRWK